MTVPISLGTEFGPKKGVAHDTRAGQELSWKMSLFESVAPVGPGESDRNGSGELRTHHVIELAIAAGAKRKHDKIQVGQSRGKLLGAGVQGKLH